MGVRDTLAPAAGTDTGFALRIAALERTVDRIGTDLQRIERQADNAAREASQARSDALMAQQIARDAQLRAR
jgi:hypothetical protein